MKHLQLRELGYAVAFLVVLMAVYMGAYYAIVKRGADIRLVTKQPEIYPRYRWRSESLRTLLKPAHTIDRRIRPQYWSNEAAVDAAMEELLDDAKDGSSLDASMKLRILRQSCAISTVARRKASVVQ